MRFDDISVFLKSFGKFSWKTSIKDEVIFNLAKAEFEKIRKGKTKTKKMIRLVGQSGSGKTTQLLPVSKNWLKQNKLKGIHFCVRDFARFHPDYDSLIKKHGKDKIREITNGFALRFLIICLFFAIEKGYDIILEMTMLTPNFEKYLTNILAEHGYRITILCLAVNIKLSNYFIEKRKNKVGVESGRLVLNSSAKFFYRNLKKSLVFLSRNFKDIEIIIWSHFKLSPIYHGKIEDFKNYFESGQKKIDGEILKEEELRKAKEKYLKILSLVK